MLKRMKPFTGLAKKVKVIHGADHCYHSHNQHHYYNGDQHTCRQALLVRDHVGKEEELSQSANKVVPIGFFAIYVGEERERFVIPTSFLSHPLFKILLEKAYDEFGFEQQSGLVVPCRVSTFREVVNAVESNHGRFDMRKLFEDFA